MMNADDVNTIDLRSGWQLSIDFAKEASHVESYVRDEYTDYVGVLAELNGLEGLDWLVSVTCRNPFQTSVFDKFCKLRLLDRCLAQGVKIETIVVDDEGMFNAAFALCAKHQATAQVNIEADGILPQEERLWSRVTNMFFRLAALLYIASISFLIPKLSFWKKVRPDSEIIFVDTFVKPTDFDENAEFLDGYYPGMVEHASDDDRERIWYAPVFFAAKTPSLLKSLIDSARASSTRFLLMEDWLKIRDYLFAIYSAYLLPKNVKQVPEYCGIDVSGIVSAEIKKDVLSTGLFSAILRYRFIGRLKEQNIRIDRVIDWNENQITDRALNLAIRAYYSGVCIIGYQGYIVSEHYVSHEPARYEIEAGTIPDKLCVVCKPLVERKKKYCPELLVTIAPAFRFQGLLNYYPSGSENRNIVLLALPVQFEISRAIIDLCLGISNSTYSFYAKTHPSINQSDFLRLIPKANDDRFVFVDEPLHTLFAKSILLISSDSSACFEAVSCGVRVVVIGNSAGPTSNPLDGIVDPRYWKVCYTSKCVIEMLGEGKNGFDLNIKNLLGKVTSDSVKDFLACNANKSGLDLRD